MRNVRAGCWWLLIKTASEFLEPLLVMACNLPLGRSGQLWPLRMRRYTLTAVALHVFAGILFSTNHLSRTHASLMLVVLGLAPFTCFSHSIVLVPCCCSLQLLGDEG